MAIKTKAPVLTRALLNVTYLDLIDLLYFAGNAIVCFSKFQPSIAI
jgi:hypothetical protein